MNESLTQNHQSELTILDQHCHCQYQQLLELQLLVTETTIVSSVVIHSTLLPH